MDNLTASEQKRTIKRTKKGQFEKGEFVGFAINEQKKTTEKNYKEILKNNPEIYQIIDENKSLKKEIDIFLDENILLGEKLELITIENKNLSKTKIIFEENRELKIENNKLKKDFEEFRQLVIGELEKNQKEISKLKKENKELKSENAEKRNIGGYVKDKAIIGILASENKEFKERLSRVGRARITDGQINKIIQLHNEGWGYGRIANNVRVAKSTVCKYVKRYIAGEL